MKYSLILALTILLVSILFSTGCLEHTYYISILPDNSADLSYEMRGDRIDMYDNRELKPDSTVWNVESRIEEKDDETTHILYCTVETDHFSAVDSLLSWGRSDKDTIHLQRNIRIIKEQKLLGVGWSLKGVIKSRDFTIRYGDIWKFVPPECRALENEEEKEKLLPDDLDILEKKFALGILQWNRNRLENRLDKVWEILKSRHNEIGDTTEIVYSIVKAGWRDDLHRYLNELDVGDPTVANLDWWDDLRSVFAGRLVDISGPLLANEIVDVADALENEYQITKDIEDDLFVFKVNLPGRVMNHNAFEFANDGWLRWEYNGKYIQNEEAAIFAETFDISWLRLSFGIVLFVGILEIIRRKIWPRRRQVK